MNAQIPAARRGICARCGIPLPAAARYCPECGAEQEPARPAPAGALPAELQPLAAEHARLRGRLAAGQITRQEFDRQRADLLVLYAGRWWTLDAMGAAWWAYDGQRWTATGTLAQGAAPGMPDGTAVGERPDEPQWLEDEYRRLRGLLRAGRMAEDGVTRSLHELMVPYRGRWWTISGSGQWCVYNGRRWVLSPSPLAEITSPAAPPPLSLLRQLKGHRSEIWAACISPDGRLALSGDSAGSVLLWDLEAGHPLRYQTAQLASRNRANALAFSPDGEHAAAGCADGRVRVWQLRSGETVKVLAGRAAESGIWSLAFSPDGRYLFSAGADMAIRQWELATGSEARCFLGHTDTVASLALAGDGNRLASLGWDGTLRLWDLRGGLQAAGIAAGPDYAGGLGRSVSFMPNGRSVLTCSYAGVDLWDLGAGQRTRAFGPVPGYVLAAVASPDGRRLFAACGRDYLEETERGPWNHSATIRTWDPTSGLQAAPAKGHEGDANVLAISANGRYLLSGSSDRTLGLWAVSA